MKLKAGQTVFYKDELNDDFMDTLKNRTVKIDGNYRYLPRNPFFRMFSFLLYYCVAIPVLWLYGKLFLRIRIEGRKNLKKLKKSGYILYCNHTNWWDAFSGSVFMARPKRTYIVASKDALSIKGIATIVRMLGGIPLPDTTQAYVNFNTAINRIMEKKQALIVYPEAHIWPYYTGVRPFSSISFKYAVAANVPAVPVAVTYRAPRKGKKSTKKPYPTIHIGEPVFPDPDVSKKEAAEKLRNATYAYMTEKTSDPDNYAYCNYVKKEEA